MSHKSRAITVAIALAVGLGIPASIAVAPAPAPTTEPTPSVADIELVPVAEPIAPLPEEEPVETPEPVSEPTPEPEPSAEPDLTDTRDPELWEAESAPWEWSQLLPDEAYIWPRCDDFYQTDCVWVASEQKVQGAAESFLALSDGDVIPLNESQALVMVGG